uniref:DUF4140 domain-containing protein n=1 Tax=Globodera pallida TaxID=36090 RepID=A0A183BM99_GLOPA
MARLRNLGKTLIKVNNVSPMISRDSIRVEGQRGALILEVEYEETPQLSGCSDWDKLEKVLQELERETAGLELRCAELNDQIEVLQRRLEVLDGVAKQIGKNAILSTEVDSPRKCHVSVANTTSILNHQNGPGQTNSGLNQQQQHVAPASLFLLCEDSMKNLTSFLDYYGKTAEETRRELREKSKQLSELKERHVKAEWELNKRRGKMEYDKNKRVIGIRLIGV